MLKKRRYTTLWNINFQKVDWTNHGNAKLTRTDGRSVPHNTSAQDRATYYVSTVVTYVVRAISRWFISALRRDGV